MILDIRSDLDNDSINNFDMCDFGACYVKCNEESDFRNIYESEIQKGSYNMNIGIDYYNIKNGSTSYISA